ncbi:TPA: LysR family transcriptional regulator [Kluyvera georgiana]|uniref:LysR family transcriptional regulator n=1 Tax=Kluyvera georgiana ATCC 51603 TaxID=1354264 RepID=A0A1B7JV12_9ENTR|nr:LysR family transcriptional regulator [Kluyvera georgiana]OAT51715.1 LysR family transcriptional regulator [Kluyvera georgiana ATCC 51603]
MRDELDIKSLRFFSALYRLGNVSPAADALSISQPTGSILLKRLRDHFDDPLFIRVGQRMEPTPRADFIAQTVFTILDLADNALMKIPDFSPQTSTRNFTLSMTDISQMTLLPHLQTQLHELGAEGIAFSVLNIDESMPGDLESGKCDLAIGYLRQVPDSIYQQRLFNQSYVCLCAANHPRIREAFTLTDWHRERHLAIRINGTGHGDIDNLLEEIGQSRRVALTLPSFLGAGELVADSNLIAVVPEQPARHLMKHYPCRIWPLPFSLPGIAIRQLWHQRHHRDPGHVWLRGLIAAIAERHLA